MNKRIIGLHIYDIFKSLEALLENVIGLKQDKL